ncbi:hypothetical protein AU476_00565 [Cupriavidus sp. UYMSc13B]|nr:hypothetical protein AU476_00565 [Cupriavidus sp. UYMSc13B]
MARIAIGGFQHETNTFSWGPAGLEDFVLGGGWPGLQRGQKILENLRGMNLPISGAIEAIVAAGHDLVPLVWTAATPSGRVDQAAFDEILAMLLQDVRNSGPLDGIYLDLHGAMATTSLDDGEGAVLETLREQVGNVPIAASLDLHANVSPKMFAYSDLMVGYRTYPHVDMADTGRRTAELLIRFVEEKRKPFKRYIQGNTLLPLTSQCTLSEPGASLYRQLEQIERENSVTLSLTLGFSLADVYDCGPAILAYGDDDAATIRAADELRKVFNDALPQFDASALDAPEAVKRAIELARGETKPIILADTQDNPGGGGQMDTTGILQALISQGAQDAVVAAVYDPDIAALAHEVGVGAELDLALGGKLAGPGSGSACGKYAVERVSEGNFVGTGPMWGGMAINLGKMALLRIGGVRVIVASRKMQAADQSILTHMGIRPAACRIIALKSSVHFRADFQDIASAILVVASPGAVTARLTDLTYQNLRSDMRLMS